MKINDLAEGDQVAVDLADLYFGICGRCAAPTLMVPGGVCSACQAPEALVVRDPLLQGGYAIRGDRDNV